MDSRGLVGHARGMARALTPRAWLRAVYQKRFFSDRGWHNLHFGVFDSYAEAQAYASAQGVARAVYTHDHAKWYSEKLGLMDHDYPVLFWLSRFLTPGAKVVDLGGSVGISYYAYAARLDVVNQVDWTVCELPEAVALGRSIAAERGAARIAFTTEWGPLAAAQWLFTAGALQFIEPTLDAILAGLAHKPEHLLVNKLCLARQSAGFVTLENTGYSITPCRVDTYERFVDSVSGQGYTLVDHWTCHQYSIEIQMHPEKKLDHFHGFYFRRTQKASDTSA